MTATTDPMPPPTDHPAQPNARRHAVATLGNFDGLHLGHAALITRVIERARALDARSVVVTFEPHPVAVLAPERAPKRIFPADEKRRALDATGVDEVVALPFDRALAAQTAEVFTETFLVGRLSCAHVVVGHDFTFGAGRRGNAEVLARLGADWGFTVELVDAVGLDDGLVVSSSAVRRAVSAGDVALAARLLGRPFEVIGPVVHGARRGRALGFPTANIAARNELLPLPGIYAAWLDAGGAPLPAAVSVGHNPTFGPHALSIEAHVLPEAAGPNLDLYGREVRLGFVHRLRDEVAYTTVEALVVQIEADVRACRALLASDATAP
jgi:riboflavin kinase/FMN adenylyltransferase